MIKKKSILFRISGGRAKNKELGLGHIYRAVNLSSRLSKHNIFFLLEDYGGSLNVLKNHSKNKIHTLDAKTSLDSDIKKTLKLLNKKNIDLLIVDKFDKITKQYVSEMKKNVKTIVVSDTDKIDYNADLVVNGFVGFKNSIFTNRFKTKCLLGPKYQILSKDYEKNNLHVKNSQNILVTFGGYDNQKLVEQFCKQMIPYIENLKIKIILGAATKKSKKLSDLDLKFNNLSIVNTVLNLKNEIKNSRFGFCAGGITTYEFALLHVPFVVICQYEHQIKTARAWEKNKMALNLGFKNKFLAKKLDKLLLEISKNSTKFNSNNNFKIDGLGARRVSNYIESKIL